MGNTGRTFIGMLSTLFHAFGNDSLGSADYAMKAAMVMQQLLLQKPVGKLTFAVSTECLQRRIASWNKGAVIESYSAKAPPSSTSSPNIEVAIADETVLQPTQHASLRLTSSRANCQLSSVSSPLIRVEAYFTWMTSLEKRQSERCCAVNILLLSQLPRRHSSKGNHQRNPTQCYSPAWTGLPYVAPPYTLAVQPDRPAWMLTDGDGCAQRLETHLRTSATPWPALLDVLPHRSSTLQALKLSSHAALSLLIRNRVSAR